MKEKRFAQLFFFDFRQFRSFCCLSDARNFRGTQLRFFLTPPAQQLTKSGQTNCQWKS